MTSAKRIPVYRLHQRALQSPCVMGEPCDVCRAHARCRQGHPCRPCRRGKDPECERAIAAEPAFTITFSQAMVLVRAGLAEFILRQTALRLKFSQIAYLRDQSLRIDEALVMAYAQGDKRARAIIDDEAAGWCVQPATVNVPAAVMMSRAERVIYFD
jgi:hypothetical protein